MLSCAALLLTFTASAQQADEHLEVQKLANGVYAAIRKEPPGLAVDANVLFVVNEGDVVLVDANIGPESASATLRALRKITQKPISAIIATHYHDDHLGGASMFLADSPQAELIAHESSPKAIEELLKPARAGMVDVAPKMAAMLQDLMSNGKSFGGWDITEEERASYKNDIRIAERYGKEMPSIPLPRPSRLVKDRLILRRGDRIIEVLHLGKGHTPSDLVVHLPKEKIVAAGDLVVYPVPLVGGPQSSLKEWPSTLGKLIKLGATKTMPGHGPMLTDNEFVSKLRDFYAEAFSKSKAAFDKRTSLQDAQKSIDLSSWETYFCGSSKLRKVLWDNYVRAPSIAAAYRECAAKTSTK